jgi:hypothetical protein
MCQNCVRLGISTDVNKKGGKISRAPEKKKADSGGREDKRK